MPFYEGKKMSERKERINAFVQAQLPVYQKISLAIHDKPEVSNYEFFASQTLSEQLSKEGCLME